MQIDSEHKIKILQNRVTELEAMVKSVGHPADDAAIVNYLEVVRLRELLTNANERIAALEATLRKEPHSQ